MDIEDRLAVTHCRYGYPAISADEMRCACSQIRKSMSEGGTMSRGKADVLNENMLDREGLCGIKER